MQETGRLDISDAFVISQISPCVVRIFAASPSKGLVKKENGFSNPLS